jgi:hypothetical protein
MIIGMSTATFTLFHVAISIVAIIAGAVVIYDMLHARFRKGWTALFLLLTVATSATGFLFHFTGFTPAIRLGIISLIVLAVTVLALYAEHLKGAWRWLYVVGAVVALYFNVFVGVVQAFQKLPFLKELAPTQTEAPFVIAQALVLAAFLVLGVKAVKRFHPGPGASAVMGD